MSERELRFVEHYLIEPNGQKAAIAAGYAPRAAVVSASRLLRRANVAAALEKARQERAERTGITAARVLTELEHLAFSDITHYTVDENGKVGLVEGAPPAALRAISKLKIKTTEKDLGKMGTITEREVEIGLWNKPETLKLAGKHAAVPAFMDKLELTGKNGRALFPAPAELSDDELKAELAKMVSKL